MDPSGSQEKKNIPRFASFRPRPAPPPEGDRPAELLSRETDEKSRHHSKHRSKHRSRRDERSRSRERKRDHRDSRRSLNESARHAAELGRERTPSSRSGVKEPLKDEPDLYVVDRRGDKYNLIYGTLHRYSVPHYHRFGRGRVLGLPPNYRIDRDSIGEDEIVVKPETWRTESSRNRKKWLKSDSGIVPLRLLRVRPTSFADDQITSATDFIPLASRHQRQHNGALGDSDTEDERYGYRSIHGKLKHDEGLPSDLEPMSGSESSGEEGARVDRDAKIKHRNVELSRNVNDRPTDVGAWLQLIDHQETVLKGSAKASSSLTNSEQKSLADIKLSLYEKALKKVGQSPGRDQILIGLLEEGSKLWDTQKLSARWHSILKSNSQYISLWVKYLDFRQTEFLNFTYDRCLATFGECLRLNRASADGPEKIQVHMYLFLRLTLFLRETGYGEYAVGLWQAILELTFFRPQGLDIDTSQDEVLSAFTDFWDSEVARIGEVGAKGWKNGNATLVDPKRFEPQCHLDPKSMLASWEACERERMLNAQIPARSLDEPEDDPYRVILASDLKGFLPLVSLPNSTSELVGGFLYFCHLPPIITVNNWTTTARWMGDSFLRNDLAVSSYASLNDWIPNSDSNAEPSISSPVVFPNQHFLHTFDTYFADPETWFYSFKAWITATSASASSVVRDWARRVLRLLVETMPWNEDLAEYSVAVEFVCNGKEAKKYAKSLLKKRSSSLRLYNAYAVMERRSGNNAAADHVSATAISMSKDFPIDQKSDSILLWHSWIWELLEARNIAHAAYLLLCMPQNSVDLGTFPDPLSRPEISPANLLKIRNYLSETQESAIAHSKPNIIKACTDCQAILLYLTHSQDLDKGLEAYTSTIKRLSFLPESAESPRSYTTELLHQSRARLLYYHLRTSTLYNPSRIRTLLAESIRLSPHNTIFLSLFAWNESRFRIEERVRDIMRDITTTHPSPSQPQCPTEIPITTHLFSIYTELNRPIYAGSTLHSARAAFERAIGDQTTSSTASYSSNITTNRTRNTGSTSLILWKLYILFELSRHDIPRAKDVFYRAMRACPWSKDILMLAFTHLREDVVSELHGSETGGISETETKPTSKNKSKGKREQKKEGQGMTFHELRRIYHVLVEKELRIHVDIERELDELAAEMEEGEKRNVSLGGGMSMSLSISMPDDAESIGAGDEMQM